MPYSGSNPVSWRAGDNKSGNLATAGAGREAIRLGHGLRIVGITSAFVVTRPDVDVVGAVREKSGELDQGYRAAGVLDVAQVEPVAEVRRDEQGG